jgi:basic amino acid/polyamine antiporter, APA family
MVVIGAIIGMGIFVYSASVASELPIPGCLMLAWAIGGVGALAGALTFAELGGLLPKAGGPYVFVSEAFGEFAGFLYGWAMLFVVTTGAIGGLALAFARQVAPMLSLDESSHGVLAASAIAIVGVVNCIGVKSGARTQNVFTFAKIAAILLVVGGAFLVPSRETSFAHFATPAGATIPRGVLGGFAAAIVGVMFAYGGWQVSTTLAAEVKDPERTLPRAIIVGTLAVIALYLTINAAYLYCLPIERVAAAEDLLAASAVRVVLGDAGAKLLVAGIVCSLFGALNAYALAMPRVYYAMAKDGVFFRAFATVSPRFRTPWVAIAFPCAWACALVLWFIPGLREFANYVVSIDWIFFTLAGASLFVLRRKMPDARRPFRVPGYPVVPLAFLLFAVAVCASTIVSDPRRSFLGLGILVAGVPFFLVWKLRGRVARA